jgi:hypothetical protein
MTLKPPYVITVLAPDLTTSKKYNISMLVRTPASLGKVPMAKGGTITMVGADEVHEFYNSKQGEALDSALEFIRDLPDDSWILLQGGGGQGGKKHEFAGIDYSGGGGGGAGAVIEHKSWSWKNSDEGNNKKIYEVHVGAASAVDPDGSNGSTYLAKRGGNSWFGYRTGNENRWRGLRAPGGGPGLNGEVTQSTSYSFRNSSNDNILTKNDSTPDQAGTITDYFNYNNIGGAQGAGAGAIYSWLFKPGSSYLFSDFLGDDLEYAGAPHIYHKCLQTYKDSDGNSLFTISDLSTTGGSGGWFAIGFETTFGGYGGGGAGGNGSAAERGYVGIMDGGGGGPGIKSSITGTEKEYGKGGKGGRSYSSGGDHGQGGNNENNSESDADSDNYRLGGNGRVIVRFAWKPF